MRLVIADTGPVNYLILIESIDLLPSLFQTVTLPTAVRDDLMDIAAPPEVQRWIAHPPEWLEIVTAPCATVPAMLGEVEAAVIALAESLHADLLLIDERKGVKIARGKGFRVTGTLGILELAAQAGLVDFAEAVGRLRRTTFRSPEALLETMLKKHRGCVVAPPQDSSAR